MVVSNKLIKTTNSIVYPNFHFLCPQNDKRKHCCVRQFEHRLLALEVTLIRFSPLPWVARIKPQNSKWFSVILEELILLLSRYVRWSTSCRWKWPNRDDTWSAQTKAWWRPEEVRAYQLWLRKISNSSCCRTNAWIPLWWNTQRINFWCNPALLGKSLRKMKQRSSRNRSWPCGIKRALRRKKFCAQQETSHASRPFPVQNQSSGRRLWWR